MPEQTSAVTTTSRPRNVEAYFSGQSIGVAWGSGAKRAVVEVSDPKVALALTRYRGSGELKDLKGWLRETADLSEEDATAVSKALVAESFAVTTEPSNGERNWDELGWADAASVFTATYDTRWVHDYRGKPTAMVRDPEGQNFGASDEPVSAPWTFFEGTEVELPPAHAAPRSMADVLEQRRTRRRFHAGSTSLGDIATVCRWTLGRQEHDPSRFVSHTYVDAGPVAGFVIIDRDAFPEEGLEGLPVGRFLLSIYVPQEHRLRVFDATDSISSWADLLWTQGYGAGAGFALILVSDVRQYQRKYPIARSYNWMSSDVGSFMQTATVAGEGVGLSVFQTPAMDDSTVTRLLRINPRDLTPAYFALFGR
jgi:hypothetical protein